MKEKKGFDNSDRHFGLLDMPRFGGMGEGVDFFITGLDKAYLLITDSRGQDCPKRFVANREAYLEMSSQRMELNRALQSSLFSDIETGGLEMRGTEMNEILDDKEQGMDSEREESDENSVQTKTEADIHKNQALIAQVQKMFDPKDPVVPPLDKLVDYKFIPDPVNGQKPLIYNTYGFPGKMLMPVSTYIFVYSKNLLIIGTLKGAKYNEYKSFMYEDVKKSSKLSVGLGWGVLGAQPGSGSKEKTAAIGPKEGEPVHEDGEEKKDGNNGIISFNASWIRKWEKLSIKAEMRCVGSFDGYDIQKISI